MSQLDAIRTYALPLALSLLPEAMRAPEAAPMLVAIGWQESRFAARLQVGGPARGFWMFETGGVRAAIGPAANRTAFDAAAIRLGYPRSLPVNAIHSAIAHHDVLAAVLARLLLWNVPDALPARGAYDASWAQYLRAWNPGRPRRATWQQAYDSGWDNERSV